MKLFTNIKKYYFKEKHQFSFIFIRFRNLKGHSTNFTHEVQFNLWRSARSTTVKTVVQGLLWHWRSFVKFKKITQTMSL